MSVEVIAEEGVGMVENHVEGPGHEGTGYYATVIFTEVGYDSVVPAVYEGGCFFGRGEEGLGMRTQGGFGFLPSYVV